MEIWLDTVDLHEIEEVEKMGILSGVTTNPTLLGKSNRPYKDLLKQILSLQNGPVTFQLTAHTSEPMLQQAQEMHAIDNRIMIKVPVTREGLKVISSLSRKNIPVMATAIFHPNQVLFAARAGASYIAPYYSKICEADVNGIDAVKSMLHLIERYNLTTKLIAASLRTPEQVKEVAEIGCQAATLNAHVFEKCIEDHPFTLSAISRFDKDWRSNIG